MLSQQLIALVYELCEALPGSENFVVEPQIKRAAWSVQNNIAEGNARMGRADRQRFFNIAVRHVDRGILDKAEVLRKQITAGVLAMSKRGR